MKRSRSLSWLAPALAVVLASCAGPTELARRSHVALEAGDPEKAYELARKALDREPGNPAARDAMTTAANRVAADWRARISRLSDVDTIGAAKQVLEYSELRAEIARYPVQLEPDSAYSRVEVTLRAAAGRIFYDLGTQSLADRRPKKAYGEFSQVPKFVSGYRDLDRQLQKSFELGTTRVVVLPIQGGSASNALARELTDRLYQDLARRVRGEDFRFTHLISEDQVWSNLSVRQLDGLSREAGLKLARKLGADRVVWTQIIDVNSDTHTDTFRGPIWRKFTDRDTSGNSVVRWEEVPFAAVSRERTVRVRWNVEVIATEDDATLSREEDTRAATARTAYTNFEPKAGLDDYALYPPDWKRRDASRCSSIDSEWKDNAGDWSLSKFLEQAKRNRSRREYRADYRNEFLSTSSRPYFLDDLPPTPDLVWAALSGIWEPAEKALRRFEPVDDVDLPAIEEE